MKRFRIQIRMDGFPKGFPIEIERKTYPEAFNYMLDLAVSGLKTTMFDGRANKHYAITTSPTGDRVTMFSAHRNCETHYVLKEI